MRYRDILVHVHDPRTWPPHLGVAARLAVAGHACLTGLYVRPVVDTFTLPDNPTLLAEVAREREQTLAAARAAIRGFETEVRAAGVEAWDWQVAEGDVAATVALAAAANDLVVLGLPVASNGNRFDVIESILLEAGRPCLLLPHALGDAPLQHALVADNGSVESMRALHGALPLLAACRSVTLLGSPARPRMSMPLPPRTAAGDVLQRHGIEFTAQAFDGDDGSAGEALLAAADGYGADLLVMGAYGHNRLREWLLGGASRHVLRHARIALLMQH